MAYTGGLCMSCTRQGIQTLSVPQHQQVRSCMSPQSTMPAHRTGKYPCRIMTRCDELLGCSSNSSLWIPPTGWTPLPASGLQAD
ncbi:hypothetical protein RB195_002089 [Necator americanus]|uniref:Uncharacterized protein n=1 Tax=Necator americanus TaxID=51031 RepID=A0ABR1DHB3_NECAM